MSCELLREAPAVAVPMLVASTSTLRTAPTVPWTWKSSLISSESIMSSSPVLTVAVSFTDIFTRVPASASPGWLKGVLKSEDPRSTTLEALTFATRRIVTSRSEPSAPSTSTAFSTNSLPSSSRRRADTPAMSSTANFSVESLKLSTSLWNASNTKWSSERHTVAAELPCTFADFLMARLATQSRHPLVSKTRPSRAWLANRRSPYQLAKFWSSIVTATAVCWSDTAASMTLARRTPSSNDMSRTRKLQLSLTLMEKSDHSESPVTKNVIWSGSWLTWAVAFKLPEFTKEPVKWHIETEP
mmetsp:Transcript_101476/g.316407  ORF Transcript_101476/g.316407 Transcript_101476/m.316407 type:complete len:300 (-) Transcript_101476:1059-1958(-)